MTEIYNVRVECEECHQHFEAVYFSSICTWLGASLIQEIYDNGYGDNCPQCGHRHHFVGTILINAPYGMFYLDNRESLEVVRQSLRDHGLIDSEGKVVSPKKQFRMLRQRRVREAVASFAEF